MSTTSLARLNLGLYQSRRQRRSSTSRPHDISIFNFVLGAPHRCGGGVGLEQRAPALEDVAYLRLYYATPGRHRQHPRQLARPLQGPPRHPRRQPADGRLQRPRRPSTLRIFDKGVAMPLSDEDLTQRADVVPLRRHPLAVPSGQGAARPPGPQLRGRARCDAPRARRTAATAWRSSRSLKRPSGPSRQGRRVEIAEVDPMTTSRSAVGASGSSTVPRAGQGACRPSISRSMTSQRCRGAGRRLARRRCLVRLRRRAGGRHASSEAGRRTAAGATPSASPTAPTRSS